eukprot:TRINITY_DN27285_c0_g1_i3.p1 TRINITY_DN27285_c0_g1~~TRINITY_DN27285_c0_g1_i3.p1  ORF type:complete len:696 (+),score=55.94 TRINITY_DN27285_c0_g1_i3:55-2142(+)
MAPVYPVLLGETFERRWEKSCQPVQERSRSARELPADVHNALDLELGPPQDVVGVATEVSERSLHVPHTAGPEEPKKEAAQTAAPTAAVQEAWDETPVPTPAWIPVSIFSLASVAILLIGLLLTMEFNDTMQWYLADTCGFCVCLVLGLWLMPFSNAEPPTWQHQLFVNVAVGSITFVGCVASVNKLARGTWSEQCLAQTFMTASSLICSIPACWCIRLCRGPSRYIRSACRCVVLLWALPTVRMIEGVLSSSAHRSVLRDSVAHSMGLNIVLVAHVWLWILLLYRIKMFERALQRHVRCGYVVIRRLFIAATTFLALARLPLCGFLREGTSAGVAGTALIFGFCLAANAMTVLAVLSFGSFARILRRELQSEVLAGALLLQVKIAAQALLHELAVVTCLGLFSGTILFCLLTGGGMERLSYTVLSSLIPLDAAVHSWGVMLVSGLVSGSFGGRHRPECPIIGPATCPLREPEWWKKVEELAHRGITIQQLLMFYDSLGKSVMPHYDPRQSTTNDVVRQAIIPLSRTGSGGQALATVWNRDQPVLAEHMVSHAWTNKFIHLVAAVVAEGLGLDQYQAIAKELLAGRAEELLERVKKRGSENRTFWICCFAVNQHAGICGGFGNVPEEPGAREAWLRSCTDTVLKTPHPLCTCCEPKFFNSMPTSCEFNKFDDMMVSLGKTRHGTLTNGIRRAGLR